MEFGGSPVSDTVWGPDDKKQLREPDQSVSLDEDTERARLARDRGALWQPERDLDATPSGSRKRGIEEYTSKTETKKRKTEQGDDDGDYD